MSQTLAIFHEAYRSLNAKKMFWVVLILSGVVVGAFAFLGVNERGFTIGFWQIESEFFSTQHISPALLYKWLFVEIGIGVWLSWIATILALVSTAGIFPDLITGGSIALVVSRPISRLRLFATQYAAGLLFVTLQVAIFSLAGFLLIGLRGGAWEPGLFIAVPLVVCFFSYLFSVCVLLGLLTRSTLAALLLTLLFWVAVYGIGAAEGTLVLFRTMDEQGVTFEDMQAGPRANRMPPSEPKAATDAHSDAADSPTEEETDDDKTTSRSLEVAHKILYGVMTVLPKTSETIALLERSLINMAELPRHPGQGDEAQVQVGRQVAEELRSRPVWWIVGTSLGFELFVLSWAALIFCRRDF